MAVDAGLPPPDEVRHTVGGCGQLLASPTLRARSSAELLGFEVELVADAVEAPLPERIFCPVRVKPVTLLALARIAWLTGAARARESPGDVRQRVRRLAGTLAEHAKNETGSVALVGHGYAIRFLTPELKALGWRCERANGVGYWSWARFERG